MTDLLTKMLQNLNSPAAVIPDGMRQSPLDWSEQTIYATASMEQQVNTPPAEQKILSKFLTKEINKANLSVASNTAKQTDDQTTSNANNSFDEFSNKNSKKNFINSPNPTYQDYKAQTPIEKNSLQPISNSGIKNSLLKIIKNYIGEKNNERINSQNQTSAKPVAKQIAQEESQLVKDSIEEKKLTYFYENKKELLDELSQAETVTNQTTITVTPDKTLTTSIKDSTKNNINASLSQVHSFKNHAVTLKQASTSITKNKENKKTKQRFTERIEKLITEIKTRNEFAVTQLQENPSADLIITNQNNFAAFNNDNSAVSAINIHIGKLEICNRNNSKAVLQAPGVAKQQPKKILKLYEYLNLERKPYE